MGTEERVFLKCSCGCSALVFEKYNDSTVSDYDAYIVCPYDSASVALGQRIKRAWAMLSGRPYKYWCGSVCAKDEEAVARFARDLLRLCDEQPPSR